MHVLLQAWVWAELCFRLADATTDHSITRIGVSASLRTGAEPSPDVVTEPKLITGNALAVTMCVLSNCESFGRAFPANVFKIRCEPLPTAKQSMRQQRSKKASSKKKKRQAKPPLHLKMQSKPDFGSYVFKPLSDEGLFISSLICTSNVTGNIHAKEQLHSHR